MLDEIPLLARALNVSIGELFGEVPKGSQTARLDADTLSETVKSLLERDAERDWIDFMQTQPERFIRAYELYEKHTSAELSEVQKRVLLGKLADLTPQGADTYVREQKVPTSGTIERGMGKGRRR